MMPTFYNIALTVFYLLCCSVVNASDSLTMIKEGMLYTEAKNALIAQGWHGVNNQQIERSSLYASEVYDQGMKEVVDCISMELDACRFRFQKGSEVLEIKTITRALAVDSFGIIRR